MDIQGGTSEAGAPWRVLKFGGTSVSTPERLDVIQAVVRDRAARARVVVVVSALEGVTDHLRWCATSAAHDPESAGNHLRTIRDRHARALAEAGLEGCEVAGRVAGILDELERIVRGIELVGDCSARTLDQVLSAGERASAEIVAARLARQGLGAVAVDAARLVVTDARHGAARVDFQATGAAAERTLGSRPGAVPVVTGFLGATPEGVRTTLGRGGSDYTAAVLGAVLNAEAVEIWTDVDGVMTADPRSVPGARPIRTLTYAELLELTHWGARVVYPKTLPPLRERGIPLWIRNTLSPDDPGTCVGADAPYGQGGPVRGVTAIDEVALVQLAGAGLEGPCLTARALNALDRAGTPTLIVSQGSSETSVCVAVPEADAPQAVSALQEAFDLERRAGVVDDPVIDPGCAVVAVVGAGMRDCPGISGRVFGVLGRRGINVRAIAQGASELNISFVVRASDRAQAVAAVHEAFFSHPGDRWDTATPFVVEVHSRGEIDPVALAAQLVAIPSLSGAERDVVSWLAKFLRELGWDVTLQPVSDGRSNVWARRTEGSVTLSTHLDTVPATFGPVLRDGRLYGRGACDAKGICAAMISAAQRLALSGEDRVDLLFVVGEEAGSDGARKANELPATSRFLVNGEPTEGVLASAAKGTQRLRLTVRGREAHSAYPERGRSAIDLMTDLLTELRSLDLGRDPLLGEATLNVGTLEGGSAANVVAGSCEAELMIRLVGHPQPVRERIEALIGDRARLSWGSHVPVQRFHVPEGFVSAPVGFTSDAPLLDRWGTPLLLGPGSIHVAHTPEEHISVEDLRESVDAYAHLIRSLL